MNYFIINTDAHSFDGSHDINVWFDQNMAFTSGPYKYGKKLLVLAPNDICLMYENAKGVMGIGRVQERWDEQKYNQPKYFDKQGEDEYRVKVDWFIDLRDAPIPISDLRKILGYPEQWAPRGAVISIKNDTTELQRILNEKAMTYGSLMAEEIPTTSDRYLEGAKVTVTVNRYERNPAARRACIKEHGILCSVCGMSFEQVYGQFGADYIHVHHLKPLSSDSR